MTAPPAAVPPDPHVTPPPADEPRQVVSDGTLARAIIARRQARQGLPQTPPQSAPLPTDPDPERVSEGPLVAPARAANVPVPDQVICVSDGRWLSLRRERPDLGG